MPVLTDIDTGGFPTRPPLPEPAVREQEPEVSSTGIVGTFFVKDFLGLSAEFLAMLGFRLGLPWALKMPLGHLVDLIWRWKSALVFLGATFIATSLAIMLGLIGFTAWMIRLMAAESWFVLAALLAPVGYVI